VKLDGSGNMQWAKTFGGTNDDFGSVLVAQAGGYAIAGNTYSLNGDVVGNHGGSDIWVVKVDASGNKQWTKTFGGSGNDFAGSMIPTVDRGYALVGGTTSNDGDVTGNHGSEDVWVVKLDGSAHKQWARTFGGTTDEYAFGIVPAADGNFTAAAFTNSINGDVSGNHGSYDFWAVKVMAQ
jgi:hypothetical protein